MAKATPSIFPIPEVAEILKTAAEPIRLAVLAYLSQGHCENVNTLCLCVGQKAMSQPAISHHLAILRYKGLITPVRDGKSNFYELTPLGTQVMGLINKIIDQDSLDFSDKSAKAPKAKVLKETPKALKALKAKAPKAPTLKVKKSRKPKAEAPPAEIPQADPAA